MFPHWIPGPRLLALLLLLPAGLAKADVSVQSLAQPARSLAPAGAFFFAAATGDMATLGAAIESGVAVDGPLPPDPPPELAKCFTPHARGTQLLTDPGATALMFAATSGETEAITALLAAGANREARTKSGLHALDLAAERGDTVAMQILLGVAPGSEAQRLSIRIDLAAQKAVLERDGLPVLTTKVSSGRKEKPTPRGKYVVTQKYQEWRSTLYHNASMPFFMRLSCSTVGLHAGVVPDHPASHGCVRIPANIARRLFEIVPRGTLVTIE